MKKLTLALCFVSGSVFAIDFDSEFAKFSGDFVRMKEIKIAKMQTNVKPEVTAVPLVGVESKQLPTKNTKDNTLQQVDPNSADRLGHSLTDPEMKKRVTELYKKPDTVVYSLTLTE
jgi:hypothetical protein